ncbi:hypothetical protein ACX3YG_20910 [Pseudomonas wadenswilerensis]
MSVGLEVLNGNDRVLIDSKYKNHFLRQKVTVSTAKPTYNWIGSVARVTITDAVCPIVLWRSAAGFGFYSLTWQGSNAIASLHTPSGPGTSVTFYVFDTGVPSHSGYGLQVYNDQGELVYDALAKPLRIKSYVRGQGSLTTAMDPLNIPLAGEYAYGSGSFIGSIIGIMSGLILSYQVIHVFRYLVESGGVLKQQQFTPYSFESKAGFDTSTQFENTTFDYQVMVADVAGY